MVGHRVGDNSQVLALAEALGLPFEIKRFVYRKYELLTNLLLKVTLSGRIRAKSSSLEPPWPDLIISAGRRNEPLCRWIQKRAGDRRVRLVHIGRPWAKLENFDLIITTPQYRLPSRDNILHNSTPLHRVTPGRQVTAAAEWRPRLSDLPQPYVAVLIGGSSGPFTFDDLAAERLARQASEMARSAGGSLLITTSARTPMATIETLSRHVDCPAYMYRWTESSTANPYFAFLELADSVIVTGDSVSMLTEACATRKPVFIFDLGEGRHTMRSHRGPKPVGGPDGYDSSIPTRRGHLRGLVYRMAMRLGPKRLTRDITIIHRYLIESGRAAWLGDPPPRPYELHPLDSVANAVARVRALVDLPATVDQVPEALPSAYGDWEKRRAYG